MSQVIAGERSPATFFADEMAAAALALARRFANGATMWCVSPRWPAHGRHVAVEFVHPVIVGKRALPAIDLEGVGITDDLRLLSRPGDVLLAIGRAGDGPTEALLRRAEAWGLTRVWLGAGTRPADTAANHLIWLEDADPDRAARSGDIVSLYHLLWELIHVVFEHPGLLVESPDCADDVCITCSDEGRVAEVRSVDGNGLAQTLCAGRLEAVDINLVAPVGPGDLVLVHAGVALTSLGATAGSGDQRGATDG